MIKREIVVRASSAETIDTVIRRMARDARRVRHVGIAVVVGERKEVVGVVTDGDIRRAYAADIPFSEPIAKVMTANPVTVPDTLPLEAVPAEVMRLIRQTGRLAVDIVRHVLVTDSAGRLVNIYDTLPLFAESDRRHSVAIYGDSFFGLAIAASLSAAGHGVTSIVADENLASAYSQARIALAEPGLQDLVRDGLDSGTLRFAAIQNASDSDHVHIIAEETLLEISGNADLSALRCAADAISQRLRQGDIVLLCSAVPVGTTRGVLRAALEQKSGLRAGEDFALAYVPERIQQGHAIAGLQSIPQLVGGLTRKCAARAAALFNVFTPFVVHLESPEAAELAKLAGNAYRDLSFAFANQLAAIADRYNLDASLLIDAANQGLSRHHIPAPSPGVGGPQLSRDPLLLDAALAGAGRAVNEEAALYPLKVATRFAARRRVAPADLKVVIVGLAFKGDPGTNDLRQSPAVTTARALMNSGIQVKAWDAVATPAEIQKAGIEPARDVEADIAAADAIFVLNNHPRNASWNLAVPGKDVRLVFDGWSLLDRRKIESAGHVYAAMGYMTPPRIAVIACDNGLGHVRRCVAVATALNENGARCDLFVPEETTTRINLPTRQFRSHSTPDGWRRGDRETVCWPERLPDLSGYDAVLSDSLPEILSLRPDAMLLGHFLWTHTLQDADKTHAARVDDLLTRHRPRMFGTGFFASDRLRSLTRYDDVGFFADDEIDLVPDLPTELLISSGLGAEPAAIEKIRDIVRILVEADAPPAPFTLIHVEPALLPEAFPDWMAPASYAPEMYRKLAAAIIRPGAGTVTDCVSRAVWMVWPEADDHQEIRHNASALVSHDIGAIAPTASSAIEMVTAFASNPVRTRHMRDVCRAMKFGAAARIAAVLMNRD